MTVPAKARRTKKNRPPVKHTKTFSGCWTCRERHVKCDEGKPECTRCLKSGFECQGYGIKLVWPNPDTQEREQNIRRAIGTPAIYDETSSFIQLDVDDVLNDIDDHALRGKSLCSGPFTVLTFFCPKTKSSREQDSFTCEKSPQHGSHQEAALATIADSKLLEANEDIEIVISPTTLDSSDSASGYSTELLNQDSLSVFKPQISRHLDLLPRPAEQRELVHHWTTFVTYHLVPVDRPDNPFRSVFTPMALLGLNSPSSSSNGHIALFHALCATSAFSRGQLLNNDTKTLTLAMKHYHLAIMHLRHSLANIESTIHSQRGSILATTTMFSVMDMIIGRSSEWRTHLQGGASWLATIEGSVWDQDKSSSMVYQGYLAIAALCNITLPSNLNVESEDFLDEKYYVLDRFFGLTRPILKHIVLMNSLIKRISTSPDLDETVLNDLEVQLYMQTPDSLDLEGLDERSAELTRHHAYVFYYASLIYFQRTVRRRPPSEVQELVKFGIAHLEEIEELGADVIGCSLVWPPFVVACECLTEDLQQKMIAWYKKKRRHGFMNLEISKDIAQELWRRRNCAGLDGDIQWQDVLKEMKMDIVLA